MFHNRVVRFAAGVVLVSPLTFAAQRPVSLPAEVKAACDFVNKVIARTPGIKLRRSTGAFALEMTKRPITGCRVAVDGSMKRLGKGPLPTDQLSAAFEAEAWTDRAEFSADGHDGTIFAYAKGGVACVVSGEWDGGSDDEPDAVLADPNRVTVTCGNAAALVRPEGR
jgi:hypothetical protein